MIIDGRALARQLNEKTQKRVANLGFKLVLCDIIVGNDPASLSYVKIKQNAAEKIGLQFQLEHLPLESNSEAIIKVINKAQANPNLCGLIVQLPLPDFVLADQILSAINQDVDVDLLNPNSLQKFYDGQNTLVPPTAGAILYILENTKVNLTDLQFVVVGQGELVGKPITYLLKQKGYRVDVVDIHTEDREQIILNADVVISGVGKANVITGEMVKDGAIVIDAGTSESDGSIQGDVNFESASIKARLITPVPGGVGPLTVAKLLENTVGIAESRK